ncbi:MAG: hypothetical protein AAF830_17020 [Pseudomonadota bacterium]
MRLWYFSAGSVVAVATAVLAAVAVLEYTEVKPNSLWPSGERDRPPHGIDHQSADPEPLAMGQELGSAGPVVPGKAHVLNAKSLKDDLVCDPDFGANFARSILIDVSDKLESDDEARRIRLSVERFVRSGKRDEWLGVFGLTESSSDPIDAAFRGCNPGDRSEHSELYTNLNSVQHRYDAFVEEANASAARLVEPQEKDFSPICEAISAIIRETELSRAEEPRLVVVSDFLQNSPGAGPTVYSADASFQSRWPRECKANLTGVEIVLVPIFRDHWAQTEELRDYWVRSLQALGASVVSQGW